MARLGIYIMAILNKHDNLSKNVTVYVTFCDHFFSSNVLLISW